MRQERLPSFACHTVREFHQKSTSVQSLLDHVPFFDEPYHGLCAIPSSRGSCSEMDPSLGWYSWPCFGIEHTSLDCGPRIRRQPFHHIVRLQSFVQQEAPLLLHWPNDQGGGHDRQ